MKETSLDVPGGDMANERLRSSITAAGHRYESVASHIGVDPKTVERWVTLGRVPHRAHRWATAELLGRDEGYLWPSVLQEPRTQAASEAEFVHLYPTRGAVPVELWRADGLPRDEHQNWSLFLAAASYSGRGVDAEEAFVALREMADRSPVLQPSWPWTDLDLRRIVRRVYAGKADRDRRDAERERRRNEEITRMCDFRIKP